MPICDCKWARARGSGKTKQLPSRHQVDTDLAWVPALVEKGCAPPSYVCVCGHLAQQARIRAATLIQALGVCVCVCVYVCMCVHVYLAQQARIRAATLIQALGVHMCVYVYVCVYVCE